MLSTVGRPREHDETTRAALLAAAERLIDEEGPDAAGVRCVADAVGTSTRAVYSVFGSKQGLLEALAIRFFEELQAATDAVRLTDDPAADLINAAMNAWRRTVLRHPSVYRLVFLRLVPDLELGPEFGRSRTARSASCRRWSSGRAAAPACTSARSPGMR